MLIGRRRRTAPRRRTHAWHETKLMRDGVLRVVAHDPFPTDEHGERLPLPADFVMGVGGATRTLLELLPPVHVGRALDVGCGSGALTVFLDADRVIGTDIDGRALEAAATTCYISGFRHVEDGVWRDGDRLIEFRQGSLFSPVSGSRFDLIVSNPPFVIAGVGHTHRDSPFEADGLTRELLCAIPGLLNGGGRAIVLTSWLITEGVPWQTRLEQWLPSAELSCWVAQREVLDLDDYVAVWGDDAAVPERERVAWRERLEALGCTHVGFGWIVLERSPVLWSHLEDVAGAARVPSGSEVLEQLGAFAREVSAVEMLHGRLRFRETHWRGSLALDAFSAALLERIRGGSTLGEAVELVAAALPVDPDDLLVHGLQFVRDALRLGYLTVG